MASGLCFCKPGFYSANCSLQCQSNCAQNECLQETGHCMSCNDSRMVTFASWNVLVLAVDHVIEEMEYVRSVQNIGLILTVIRHVQIIVKKVCVIGSLVNVKIV